MGTSAATRKPSSAGSKAAPAKSSSPAKRQQDACALLDADHKAVKAMFKEYETLTESRSRSPVARSQVRSTAA